MFVDSLAGFWECPGCLGVSSGASEDVHGVSGGGKGSAHRCRDGFPDTPRRSQKLPSTTLNAPGRSFTAPFWKYDCVKYELCPQWASLPCVHMEDAWQLVRERQREMVVMEQQTAAANGNSSSAVPLDDKQAKQQSEHLAGYAPRQVLILGEGGSGAPMLAQLFARSSHYMLWRQPKQWQVTIPCPRATLHVVHQPI